MSTFKTCSLQVLGKIATFVHSWHCLKFLPSATKLRRLCVYTCLSFCSQDGSASVHAGIHTPLGADTPPPWEQTPPGAVDTPWSRHTPLSRPPPTQQTATAADSYCCGWYASYRNAFLWNIHLGCLQGEMPKTKHMIYFTDDTQAGLV